VSGTGWIVFLAVAIPLLVLFLWVLFQDSVYTVPSGKLGLLVVKGKATDRTLLPGPHWVPALRRRSVQEYPSVELSYRARGRDTVDAGTSDLERSGPAVPVVLGDKAVASVAFTVRFRLLPGRLRTVHERFGPDGIWAVVRDETTRAVTSMLVDARYGVDHLVGPARRELEEELAASVREVLAADGFEVTLFTLGEVDLGRMGEVIQATLRTRLELERETAEAALRLARVRNDGELLPYLAGTANDVALRYRENDLWRDLVEQRDAVPVAVPPRLGSTPPELSTTQPVEAGDAGGPA
jgi:regulator of protease activity HflC (stomatin/prohibitin superfamily)